MQLAVVNMVEGTAALEERRGTPSASTQLAGYPVKVAVAAAVVLAVVAVSRKNV